MINISHRCAYLIQFVDGHDDLAHTQTSDQKQVLSRLTASLKACLELPDSCVDNQ